MKRELLWEGNTEYGHYQVIDTLYDGRLARVLYSGNRQAAQSGIATDGKADLLFDYNQRLFELITNVMPKRLLLIGGGACTLPQALLAALPELTIDVVEIDSGLTHLAHRFFGLQPSARLRVFHTDGRAFLASHPEKYDMILVDAFTHTAIPRQLKTVQATSALHTHLGVSGMVAMNIISAYSGSSSYVLRELYAAYCQVFDSVDIFLASRGYNLWLPQNFILTAQKQAALPLKEYMRYEAVAPPEATPLEALHD